MPGSRLSYLEFVVLYLVFYMSPRINNTISLHIVLVFYPMYVVFVRFLKCEYTFHVQWLMLRSTCSALQSSRRQTTWHVCEARDSPSIAASSIPRSGIPDRNKKKKQIWTIAPILICFLSANAMWPAVSHPVAVPSPLWWTSSSNSDQNTLFLP